MCALGRPKDGVFFLCSVISVPPSAPQTYVCHQGVPGASLYHQGVSDAGIYHQSVLDTSSSAATGEPAMCLASSCLNALRRAVAAARRDLGDTAWVTLGEFTPSQLIRVWGMYCSIVRQLYLIGVVPWSK